MHKFCGDEIKQIFNNLVNQYLLRKFSLGFKRDEQGNNRNWKEVEESKITDLFEVNKKRADDCIDDFKLIGFPVCITQTNEADDYSNATHFNMTEQIGETPFGSKMSTVHLKILSEEEVGRVRNKFYEDIDYLREEAIQRHRSSSTGDIPFWFWVLLAWFASDNIMGWIASPILFYPLLLISAICLVLH